MSESASKWIWEFSLRRRKTGELAETGPLSCPERAADLCRSIDLHEREQECLFAVILDTKNCLRGVHEVSRGLTDRASAHAREVYQVAVLMGASRVVLTHNHPSGDPTPSSADIRVTHRLVEAGQIIGIELVDHVVLGDPDRGKGWFLSMRAAGLWPAASRDF